MKTGYRSLTWVNDKDGHEYVCSLDVKTKKYEDLTEEEKRKCANVNQIVGTERW